MTCPLPSSTLPMEPASGRRLARLWLALCLAVLLALPAAAAANQAPPPLVTVARVAEQNVQPVTEYVGHVEAVQTVDLQARVSGFLEQIHFKEGSDVRLDQLLYLVEPAPYRMRVAANQARATKAEAILKKTRQQLERVQAVRSGGVSITDIESAEAAEQQARAELQEAQAALQLSEIDLAYTRILAPINGRIGATALTVGNLCGPNSGPLARIVQLDPIRVLFSISENDLAAVQAAQQAATRQQPGDGLALRLKSPDGAVMANRGRIDFVDNRVDPATGTIAVRALFDNPEARLLPGQYVRLVAGQGPARLRPVVPQAAVLEDREGRYVLLVDEQSRVEQRRITTGPAVGGLWTLESGLTAGELLIVEGLQKVRPGQLVTTGSAVPQGN